MKLQPYMYFDGNAEEAFQFYKAIFGGEILANMKMIDIPDGNKLSKKEQSRTLHIALRIADNIVLMASDILPSAGQITNSGSQTAIMIDPDSRTEADMFFNGLAKKGNVELKMEDTIWGSYFGKLTDKFGIQWMINFIEPEGDH